MTKSDSPDLVARNRAILDTAVDAIITIDERGIVETVNQATSRMLGYADEEVIGQNVSMLMPEPFSSEHDEYLAQYRQTGDAKIIGIGREVIARKKDGSTFPIHLAVSEFYDSGRRMFTGIIRDITDISRTREKLLQSARLAAIGQMVTGLAHESRNALQRAQAFLDMLELDLGDQPEQLALTRKTQKSLQDLYRLYEEVRNYAAPIQLEKRPVNLLTICENTWQRIADNYPDRKIRLIQSDTCKAVDCAVDVHRIGQVFRNILENAIDACAEECEIEVDCQLLDPLTIVFSIQDNGSGLPSEAAERLFEPFFTTKQRGTGLGLAICQRIVEAHSGKIQLGTCEAGTRIEILLPVANAPAPAR